MPLSSPASRATRSKPSSQDLTERFWASHADALLTRDIVGAALSYSPRWLRSLANRGFGPPCIRLPGQCLYRKRDVLQWLKRFEQGAVK